MSAIPTSMPTPIPPVTSTGPSSPNNSSGSLTNGTQSMFLQLLTAQLENQSPLDPVDPTQFTDQLVQFNMLDQLTQINNTLTNAFPAGASGTTGSGTGATPPTTTTNPVGN